MSQNNNFSSVNKTSSFDNDAVENSALPTTLLSTPPDTFSDSNDDWKSVDDNNDLVIDKTQDDYGWASFGTNEDKANSTSENITVTTSNDDWAEFESSALPSTEQSIAILENRSNKEDDTFGDYSEVLNSTKSQESTLLLNLLSIEQIESLISTCFPLESPTLCVDTDDFIPSELPTFTTCNDQTKQTPCFHHSLSLWKVLANISNDPLGIQHQWRKSHVERLFHQALGVHERFPTKMIPLVFEISHSDSQTSTENNENKSSSQTIDPRFDWKRSGLENPLTDDQSAILPTNSSKTENHVLDVNKTLDLDYYIPLPLSSTREQQLHFSTVVHRNSSPILHPQSTPIKTIDLFPGSTTVGNDDAKPVLDTIPNFSFMNPKALMSPTQINNESMT